MCNSGFEWIPKVIPEPAGTDVEASEPTGSESSEPTLLPIMYALVPIIACSVAIGAAFFVIKQRKAARFAAVNWFKSLKC